MTDVRTVVRAFILEHCLPGEDPRNLSDEMELKESGILDSLSTLKLVAVLEQSFGIELEADDLDPGNLSSIESIERLVKGKMGSLT